MNFTKQRGKSTKKLSKKKKIKSQRLVKLPKDMKSIEEVLGEEDEGEEGSNDYDSSFFATNRSFGV